MSKDEKFSIIAGTKYEMINVENKAHSIASWYFVNYSHKTRSKRRIRAVKTKSEGKPVCEIDKKVYILP